MKIAVVHHVELLLGDVRAAFGALPTGRPHSDLCRCRSAVRHI
ncbi:hypothetical protein [Streptomyces sp. NPDC048643]